MGELESWSWRSADLDPYLRRQAEDIAHLAHQTQLPEIVVTQAYLWVAGEDGRRWAYPEVTYRRGQQVCVVWGDPPMLEVRTPLRRRWWHLRQRWQVQAMPLQPAP